MVVRVLLATVALVTIGYGWSVANEVIGLVLKLVSLVGAAVLFGLEYARVSKTHLSLFSVGGVARKYFLFVVSILLLLIGGLSFLEETEQCCSCASGDSNSTAQPI